MWSLEREEQRFYLDMHDTHALIEATHGTAPSAATAKAAATDAWPPPLQLALPPPTTLPPSCDVFEWRRPPASDDDAEDYSESDDADDNEHDFGPLQSSFYGVTWDRKKGRWRAAVRLAKRLGYEGQVYNIGMFDHAWVGVRSLARSFEGAPEATVSP